jgi:hypothetical protein
VKIAILLSGQPRFIQQGSSWIKNRIFNQHNGYKVDFYVHFWDNGDPELENKIIKYYDPVKYKISSYDQYIAEFISQITIENQASKEDFRLVPKYIRENILFDTYEPTYYGKNFWGQFLSTYEVSQLVKNYHDYDVVIKTRSDVIMNPMNADTWRRALGNVTKSPVFKTKIFTPWLHTLGGIPYFCDFVFISTPETWLNYSAHLRENCLKLSTENKALFYEFNLHEFQGISHWVWNKLSIYNSSGFLSFSVTWPMKFEAILLREDIDISKMNYENIHQIFLKHNN